MAKGFSLLECLVYLLISAVFTLLMSHAIVNLKIIATDRWAFFSETAELDALGWFLYQQFNGAGYLYDNSRVLQRACLSPVVKITHHGQGLSFQGMSYELMPFEFEDNKRLITHQNTPEYFAGDTIVLNGQGYCLKRHLMNVKHKPHLNLQTLFFNQSLPRVTRAGGVLGALHQLNLWYDTSKSALLIQHAGDKADILLRDVRDFHVEKINDRYHVEVVLHRSNTVMLKKSFVFVSGEL